jgi:hypothetical protein
MYQTIDANFAKFVILYILIIFNKKKNIIFIYKIINLLTDFSLKGPTYNNNQYIVFLFIGFIIMCAFYLKSLFVGVLALNYKMAEKYKFKDLP